MSWGQHWRNRIRIWDMTDMRRGIDIAFEEVLGKWGATLEESDAFMKHDRHDRASER